MSSAALVMAGGRGERMAASHGAPIKPLVAVRGVPMIERNLLALLGGGFTRITVALSDSQPALREFVTTRGRDLASAVGATLSDLVETEPLGTIGCASMLAGKVDDLLVVNADNLTSLDLSGLLAWHRARRAAMTVATHEQTWRSTLGEVEVDGDRLLAYHEKPERRSRISSGIYVLGRPALELLTGDRTDVPDLVHELLGHGAAVHAFGHDALWIDVNDGDAVARAEALIAAHSDTFECWCRAPDVEVAGVLLAGERGILLERRPDGARLYPGVWDTPGGKLEPGEQPEDAARREIREELAVQLDGLRHVVTFDDVDTASRAVVRHHVFATSLTATPASAASTVDWLPLDDTHHLTPLSPVVQRSLAAWRDR